MVPTPTKTEPYPLTGGWPATMRCRAMALLLNGSLLSPHNPLARHDRPYAFAYTIGFQPTGMLPHGDFAGDVLVFLRGLEGEA